MARVNNQFYQSSDLKIIEVPRDGWTEFYITTILDKKEPKTFDRRMQEVAGIIKDRGVNILSQEIFGISAQEDVLIQSLTNKFNNIVWPVTCLEGETFCRRGGTQFRAVAGLWVTPIKYHGNIVGNVYEDRDAVYCFLGGIGSDDQSLPCEVQARQTFEKIENILQSIGMEFTNVVRTWFYLKDILEWYQEFNSVRNQFFTERNIFKVLVPASTGIYGKNSLDAALITELMAIKPLNNSIRVYAVPSPLQSPALQYGSSFNRAVEIDASDHRRLLVSGTASISPNGESLHIGNMSAQIAQTMAVVEAILESRGMDWKNVCRATAYVKYNDINNLMEYLQTYKLLFLPIICAQGDICRDELLFEIEVDAIAIKGTKPDLKELP